jgi:hypothetical protein
MIVGTKRTFFGASVSGPVRVDDLGSDFEHLKITRSLKRDLTGGGTACISEFFAPRRTFYWALRVSVSVIPSFILWEQTRKLHF